MSDQDPLTAFLAIRKEHLGEQRPFEGGEHIWLGNQGAAVAHARLGRDGSQFGPFARAGGKESLTYGELVALSGDFYRRPTELFYGNSATIPWLCKGNDLDGLKEVLEREVEWIATPPTLRRTNYPDSNLALWWHAKQYAELALDNNDHFGWYNALEYARRHAAALDLAALAHDEADAHKKDRLLRHAIFTNAFADHFLTDGFAAGHVRSPAVQIRAWAQRVGHNAKLAGALLKLVHDNDGHVDGDLHGGAHAQGQGLHVVNARGDSFHARCDGQLFMTGTDDPAIGNAVEAVADSVEELLGALDGKAVADGPFRATQRIPWPAPDTEPLVQKFQAGDGDRIRKLVGGFRWYLKLPVISTGLRERHVEELFANLPELMEAFRDDVAASAASTDAKRLAPELIAAYREIR